MSFRRERSTFRRRDEDVTVTRVTLWHGFSFVLALGVCKAAAPLIAAVQDADPALAAARLRAGTGDAVAQFSVGSILYYGTKQTAEAVEWIKKAAVQGHAAAEFQMGQMHDFGFGVPQDDRQALEWYQRAAGHGSAAGQRSVGDFYQKGRAIPADAAAAVRWYQHAAEADDLRAQYQLGQAFFSGTGVARNYVTAYLWFTIAAGQTPLKDNRMQLVELANIAAARMTPEQLAEAQRRVAAWRSPAPRR